MQNESYIEAAVRRQKHGKRWISILCVLILIPLTIMFGVYFLDDKKYYFISLLMIIYTVLPFFASFERHKPQARELVILAVLIAIAVAGRTAFIMIPGFKPLVAVAVVAGVAFGAESGFMCGAMAAFISNFFMGQGPWTPWQMFAYGIVAFLAGLFCEKGWIGKDKVSLSIFGGAAVLFICSPILELCTVFTISAEVNLRQTVAVFIAGFPMDMSHAISTAVFLLLISQPMIVKLNRVKVKYGMGQEV